jgi:porphyrinogen peroxidase
VQASDPQPVLTPITEAAIFLVVTIDAGAEDGVRELLADLGGLKRSVGFRIPEAELSCVAGIGAALWDRMFDERPAGLHQFEQLTGATHVAVSTPGDLLFHIRAHRFDLCFELAQLLMGRIAGLGRAVDEVHGFRSFDERDLLGFVDGTENPEGSAARDAVLIGDEDPGFAGGCYVVVQKYMHDLDAWNMLSVEQQEGAIGRTKLSDIELPDEQKPANSHVTLNTILDEDGRERQIVRFNMPFGSAAAREFGTYFAGYARSSDVIEQMLRNMFIGKPLGNHDRILDFSTAVTGNLFFVPTIDFLEDPPAAIGATAASEPSAGEPTAPDPSLGIGSLQADASQSA